MKMSDKDRKLKGKQGSQKKHLSAKGCYSSTIKELEKLDYSEHLRNFDKQIAVAVSDKKFSTKCFVDNISPDFVSAIKYHYFEENFDIDHVVPLRGRPYLLIDWSNGWRNSRGEV